MSVRVALDTTRPLAAQPELGHNRWHPDIPPIASIACGTTLRVDTRDGIDGQIGPDSRASDLPGLEMHRGHPMTGPFWIEGAQPGDVLEVETAAIEPDGFGFTLVRPGAGLLGAELDEPYLVRWTIADGVARSDDLPGVSIAGEPFMGVMGVAPSHAGLAAFTAREHDLLVRGGGVRPPDPRHAVPADGPAATDGLRTVPPRENGGNIDIKQVGVGSRLLLPVDVPGALFSVGDAHFAQGDGESCSQAIEMHATAELRFGLRKAAELEFRPRFPAFEFTEPARSPRRYFATTGIPVDTAGVNHDFDVHMAAKAALREMVAYLEATRTYSRPQAHALCSVAVDLRISEVVNTPNALVSALLPLDIFDSKGTT
jgi:formamidase